MVVKAVYYMRFIEDYAKIAFHLYQLTKRGVEFVFGKQEYEAFLTLKQKLCEAPVLCHPDLKRPFTVQTDASGYGLGAVLTQTFDSGPHPIAYASRVLKEAETRYSATEKEALGVFWAVKYFEQYLHGTKFAVETDHRPLLAMFKITSPNARVQNYALRLQHFHFDLKYREGKRNGNADALSRFYYRVPLKSELEKEALQQGKKYSPPPRVPTEPPPKSSLKKPKYQNEAPSRRQLEIAALHGINVRQRRAGLAVMMLHAETTAPNPEVLDIRRRSARSSQSQSQSQGRSRGTRGVNPWVQSGLNLEAAHRIWSTLKASQEADPFLGPLMKYLRKENPNAIGSLAKALVKCASDFCLDTEGILLKFDRRQAKCVVCIPKTHVQYALEVCHNPPWAGHKGMKGTIKLAQMNFWWPRMTSDCNEYVRRCAMCVRYKYSNRNPVAPMGRTDLPNEIWQNVYMDHVTIGNSTTGYKGVLAFIDYFSKYVILEPVQTYSADEVIRVFLTRVAPIYGLPDKLISDNGPAFRAALNRHFFAAAGVTRQFCTPYLPQANGQVERLFKTLKATLSILSANIPNRWPEVIPYCAFAYNTSYLRAIDNTPYFLMFGRDPDFRLGQTHLPYPVELEDDLRASFDRLEQARATVRQKLEIHRQKMKKYYDSVVSRFFQNRAFQQGQLVWVKPPPHFKHRPGVIPALAPKFIGPCRVIFVCDQILGVKPIHDPRADIVHIPSNNAKQCLYDDGFDADLDFGAYAYRADPNLEESDDGN